MRTLRTTAGVLAAAIALASCTADEGTRDSATGEPAPASTSPTSRESGASNGAQRPKSPARPPAKGCYVLGFDAATEPTNDSRPVPCSKRHTAQTYHVGRLDTVVDGHLLAVDSETAQRQVERTCPRKLVDYVGGSPEARALSRLRAVWFSPTIEQSDQGASWFRCDVVAVARPSTLASLPPPGRLRGILDRADALDEVGLCGTAAPGARGFERVICSRRHAWRASSTIEISGGAQYPGIARVREAGERECRERVQEATGSPQRFSYGWEWPTREQWRGGQRFGYCWAPD